VLYSSVHECHQPTTLNATYRQLSNVPDCALSIVTCATVQKIIAFSGRQRATVVVNSCLLLPWTPRLSETLALFGTQSRNKNVWLIRHLMHCTKCLPFLLFIESKQWPGAFIQTLEQYPLLFPPLPFPFPPLSLCPLFALPPLPLISSTSISLPFYFPPHISRDPGFPPGKFVKFDAFLGKIWPLKDAFFGCRQFENRHILKLLAYSIMLNLRRQVVAADKVKDDVHIANFSKLLPQRCNALFWQWYRT